MPILLSMETGSELRAFLTSRRAAISPEQVGLPQPSTARRVKGLRREEVATLAGVSVDYYVKLEQGRVGNVSGQVIEALVRALRLDDVEARHLRSLLHPGSDYPPRRTPAVSKARPALLSTIHAMDAVPAIIHGPHLEILGINRAGKTLLDDYDSMPLRERNTARWMFLNPRARTVYRDWEEIAVAVVAVLRAGAVPGSDDPVLDRLVRELKDESPEFARMWADYRLSEHRHGVKRFFHEMVGDMRLNYETMQVPRHPEQTIILYTADTGSPSEEKLRLLAGWAAEPAQEPLRKNA